eukprot:1800574-Amphidinium_carterae.1
MLMRFGWVREAGEQFIGQYPGHISESTKGVGFCWARLEIELNRGATDGDTSKDCSPSIKSGFEGQGPQASNQK